MKIEVEKLDKNLVASGDTVRDDAVFYDIKKAPFRLYGNCETDKGDMLRRLPIAYSDRVSEGCTIMSGMTVGIRARFSTDSPYMILRVHTPSVTPHTACSTIIAMKGFDVYLKDEEGKERYYQSFRPPVAFENGYEAIVEMPGGRQAVTLYFPQYNQVDRVEIGLAETASIGEGDRYTYEKPILFFGSSITQGCGASRTGNVYSSVIGRMLDADTVNLGFSGGAKGQLPIAEYISTCDLSAFVYDYDHNAPDAAFLERTHQPFFEVVRAGSPTLPIVVVSMPNRRYPDLKKRRDIIYKTYEEAKKTGDKNVYFIDGGTFFTGEFWDMCTADGTHPNDLGYLYMAKGICSVLREILDRENNRK